MKRHWGGTPPTAEEVSPGVWWDRTDREATIFLDELVEWHRVRYGPGDSVARALIIATRTLQKALSPDTVRVWHIHGEKW